LRAEAIAASSAFVCIAGAIAVSGPQAILKTFGVEIEKNGAGLLDAANDKAVANEPTNAR